MIKHSSAVTVGLREIVAKAMFARRYQMDAASVDSMFKWYADDPKGTDKSRLAIYSAFRDADAALDAIARHGVPAQQARERAALAWAMGYLEGYDHVGTGSAPSHAFVRDYLEKLETIRILIGKEREYPSWRLSDHFSEASALPSPDLSSPEKDSPNAR